MLRDETLRYLRYMDQILSAEQNAQIDSAIAEVVECARPRTVHRIFDLIEKDGYPAIEAAIDLRYDDLKKLLADCGKCMLVAGTLGIEVDRRLKYFAGYDMTRYVIMDAAASAYVEEICDSLQASLPFQKMTFRFAPGYGDVPLSMQKQLLNVLDTARRIGLTLTPTLLMTPTKSITGIVGIGREDQNRSCSNCKKYDNCEYRRNNSVCYQTK